MKNPKVQFVIVTMVLVCIGVLLISSMTQAEPKGMPWQEPQEQREGYSRSFVIDANSVLLEVPEGKCYVLLRLYSRGIEGYPDEWDVPFWTLTIDGETFLDEYGLYDPWISAGTGIGMPGTLIENFPDKCVVVRGGETLGIIKDDAVVKFSMTLIGYFCDMP